MPFRYSTLITLPFWLACVVLLALSVGASWYVHTRNLGLTNAVSDDVDSVQYAQELSLGVREIRTQLNRYLLTRDPRHLEAVPALDQQTADWLTKADATIRTPRGRELIDKIRHVYDQFQADFVYSESLSGDEQWQTINHIRESHFTDSIIPNCNEFLEQKQRLVQDTVRANSEFAEDLAKILLALGFCGACAGVIVGYLMSVSTRRAVVELSLPIHDAAGKLGEVVGPVTIRNATNLDEIQKNLSQMATQVTQVVERFQQSQREALRAEQLAAVGQMAAGMAHELRNPLTSVKILIQSANERRALGPRDLLVLEEEVERLETLIQSFLDFARPPQPQKRRVNLVQVAQDTVRLFRPRSERLQTQLTLLSSADPVWVWGDVTQLHQLLLNLLVNALDAVVRGGHIQIEIVAPATHQHSNDATESQIMLRVSDDGCGLPSDLGNRIFDPFVSSKQTGIGMGLSICRRIVDVHGGTVSAAAQSPKGTVITVQLPSVQVSVPAAIA